MDSIIEQKLSSYTISSKQDEMNSLKEIFQELALFALSRTDFFSKAAFMGGTALRILHGLPRFSEDLDFSLFKNDPSFTWGEYLKDIQLEFSAHGISLTVQDKSSLPQAIKKAFLKDQSFGQMMTLRYPRKKSDSPIINIRLEIDSKPPKGGHSESRFGSFPIHHAIIVHDLSTLFSGKINAILARNFTKGRDWFDWLWFVSRGVMPNKIYFSHAQEQFHRHSPKHLSEQLRDKITSIDWKEARKDVEPLLHARDRETLKLWSTEFFLSQLSLLKE